MKIKPHWQILAALVLATLTAFLFRALAAGSPEGSAVADFVRGAMASCEFLGKDVFMGLLKMIIVPLIVLSLIHISEPTRPTT